MKTYTYETYDVNELKEKFPEGFKHALDKWREYCWEDIFGMDDIVESLKAVFNKAGIILKDWSLGAYGNSYVSFYNEYLEFEKSEEDKKSDDANEDLDYWEGDDYEEIRMDDVVGTRAMEWLTENLFDGAKFTRVEYEHEGKKHFRYDGKKKDGKDWSCEFTGVCFDHDYVDDLLENIRLGYSLYESFKWLADKCEKLIELELENQQSEEYFIDHADANGYEFTEDGEMA